MNNDRLLELHADRAMGETAEEPFAEDRAMLEQFELAMAATLLATIPIEPMPAHLRARLAPPKKRTRPSIAWLLAAACLVVAIFVWMKKPKIVTVRVPVAATSSAPHVPTLVESREALRKEPDAVTWSWSATKDPASTQASGDVVWSAAKQEGYMRFSGLQPNDPKITQYQLWIFDAERDEKYPVDGGVFDVTTGETIVKIHKQLDVKRATLFAITVEKPGGVVVSKRERIVLLAKPS